MARIANIFNKNLPISKVIAAVAIQPEVVHLVKNLIHTGKRGRPSKTINGKKVFSILNKANAPCAMSAFKDLLI